MKYIIILIIALLPFAGAAQFSITSNFTLNPPTGRNMDSMRNGIGAEVGLRYGFGQRFVVGMNTGYTHFDSKPVDYDLSSYEAIFIPVMAAAELNLLTGRVKPYISFDGGLYHTIFRYPVMDRRGKVTDKNITEDKGAIAPGAGLKIGLNDRVDLNASFKYNVVFYDMPKPAEQKELTWFTAALGFVVYLGDKD